jgi:hypothetical protein
MGKIYPDGSNSNISFCFCGWHNYCFDYAVLIIGGKEKKVDKK